MKAAVRQVVVLVFACSQLVSTGMLTAADKAPANRRPLKIDNLGAGVTEATISGPPFSAPKAFHAFEQFDNPRIKQLRDEYRLVQVVEGEPDEFRRMLKLRHWVHSRWPIDNEQRFSGDAFAILEKAKTGAGFHCSHAMRVQHAVMTAMGYVARDLGVDCDHKQFGRSMHHGVNEVWSNQYAKWVLLDAKYDIHFERAGVPLSALEVHESVRADGGKDVVRMQGPDRQAVPMKELEFPTSSAAGYWWVSYHAPMDRFTGDTRDSRMIIFDNAAFRETKWFRGGAEGLKEHWAYGAKAFLPTDDRRQVEWAPGVPGLQVRQTSPTVLEVTLESVTPNLKAYQFRVESGSWRSVGGSKFRWKLQPGANSLDVRTLNQFDVTGPVVTARVVFKQGDQ